MFLKFYNIRLNKDMFLSKVNNILSNLNTLPLRSDLHLSRKLWHIGMGFFGIILYNVSNLDLATFTRLLFGFSILLFILEIIRLRSSYFNSIAVKIFSPFIRGEEYATISGMPYYVLGVSISLLLFPKNLAIISCLFLFLADPIGSFFGILYGSKKIIGGKTLEGSIANYITCFVVTIIFGIINGVYDSTYLYFSAIAGLVGAISEIIPFPIDDNLTIPVLSASGLTFINLFFYIF